jgi:hypothetical protein
VKTQLIFLRAKADMNKSDWTLIERIFSDCHIKDVDLSEWDRRISLLVVADHLENPEPGRKPVLLVHFLRVSELRLSFNHLNIDLGETKTHFQWQVDTIIHESGRKDFHRVKIAGLMATPTLEIKFESIEVEPVSLADLDHVFPDWMNPSGPLIRPGIQSFLREK